MRWFDVALPGVLARGVGDFVHECPIIGQVYVKKGRGKKAKSAARGASAAQTGPAFVLPGVEITYA